MDRSLHTGATRPEALDSWTISVSGLVAEPATLTVEELKELGFPVEVRPEVECPDGIGTRGAVYTGVPIEEVLRHSDPASDGQYVTVHSGPYAAGFSLESLARRGAVLAYERNGEPIRWEEGGPVRLVVVVGACFDTVKWVDKVTVERDMSAATAIEFVRQRRGAESVV